MTLSKSRNRNFYIGILPVFACLMICIFFFSMAFAQEANPDGQNTRNEYAEYAGRYCNNNYLFSFSIPQGFTCFGDPAPNPNHGCGIRLSEHPKRHIWTDGSYDVFEKPTVSAYLDMKIGWRKEKGAKLSILRRETCLLGGIEAQRAVLTYKLKDQEEAVIEDIVVSYRAVEGWGEFVYTAGMISTESQYENDHALFERIVSSWSNDPPE